MLHHFRNRLLPSSHFNHSFLFIFTTSFTTFPNQLPPSPIPNNLHQFLSLHHPPTLPSLLNFHSHIITTGHTHNLFISSKLISLYASFHKPDFSTKVFNTLLFKDPFLWNSIIKAHFYNCDYFTALQFYLSMKLSDSFPNLFTFPMVVTACAELGWLEYGMVVHGLVIKLGVLEGDSAIRSSLVGLYSRSGCMEDACYMFDEITERDVVAWTVMVIGYVKNGESEKGLACIYEMIRNGGVAERPNWRTMEGGFQGCGNLGAVMEGRCLHAFVVKSGIECSEVVKYSIFSMYSKCGTLEEACSSFWDVPVKDMMSWTSIIGMYVRFGFVRECLGAFMEMLVGGIQPDETVISCVLSGLANSLCVSEGKAFHGFILRRGYNIDQMVFNGFLSMYCKFGQQSLFEKLFNGVQERNMESWNIMVNGYSKIGEDRKCVDMFREIIHLNIKFDSSTLVSVISSCSQLKAVKLGRSLHCYMIKGLMHGNLSVSNSLIDMYGKSGNMAVASGMFWRMERDTVTWNTMISTYTHNGHFAEAFSLFDRMVSEGINPTSPTLVTLLSACSQMASMKKGARIHNYIKEGMLELNLTLATALVDMYAKCGQLEKSRELFDMMKEKDTIAWNVMISGYGMHGDAESAIEIFQKMEQSNVRPNKLSFLAVLMACTHAGLVEEGKSLFQRMRNYSLEPTLKHYGCMVDLLGRSGNLLEAEALALSMPIAPDGGLWGAILSSCKIHNDPEMGIRIAKHAIESDPQNDGYYIMISNLYNSIGMPEEAERMRITMKERGVKKKAGWSTL